MEAVDETALVIDHELIDAPAGRNRRVGIRSCGYRNGVARGSCNSKRVAHRHGVRTNTQRRHASYELAIADSLHRARRCAGDAEATRQVGAGNSRESTTADDELRRVPRELHVPAHA